MTATAVKATPKVPGTYQDGEELFLKVDKGGGASWYLGMMRNGRRRDLSLGSAKLISLAEARAMGVVARKAVKVEGRDIIAERRKSKAEAITFRQAAERYHAENKGGWKSSNYSRQWLDSLERHVFPRFGDRPANEIAASDTVPVGTRRLVTNASIERLIEVAHTGDYLSPVLGMVSVQYAGSSGLAVAATGRR